MKPIPHLGCYRRLQGELAFLGSVLTSLSYCMPWNPSHQLLTKKIWPSLLGIHPFHISWSRNAQPTIPLWFRSFRTTGMMTPGIKPIQVVLTHSWVFTRHLTSHIWSHIILAHNLYCKIVTFYIHIGYVESDLWLSTDWVNLSVGHSKGRSYIYLTYLKIVYKFAALTDNVNFLNLFSGSPVGQTLRLTCDLILQMALEMPREICKNNCNLGGVLIFVTKFWKWS